MTPAYRKDIDGLRAVAVLSVLFFHSGISVFSGGYVGVDIFFVISGYLISTIIVREIENESFSISSFYERRFRRILPALGLVTVASLVIGYYLLTPRNYILAAQSAVATTLFSSNLLFYSESGYFDGPAELKPLLHTWSLAVEEQFYIFFPLLLVFISKAVKKQYLLILLSLGVLSFLYSVMLVEKNPSAAFYWFPARAWELFIGAILSIYKFQKIENRAIRELISISGLAMIFYSVIFFTEETKFPGFSALLPTLGTAMIIFSGEGGKSLVSNVLSLRPIVFVGLISYSLYLWHWPVIVYTKLYAISALDLPTTIAMISFIFLMSFFSWRYIESPFRKKAIFSEKWPLIRFSVMSSLLIIMVAVIIILKQGYPKRVDDYNRYTEEIFDKKWERLGACENAYSRLKNGKELCKLGEENKKASFMLWGDSHAKSIASGLELSARKQNLSGYIATKSACPPLVAVGRTDREDCDEINASVLTFISESPEIETVILAARWAMLSEGVRYKQETGRPVKLITLSDRDNEKLTNPEILEIGLIKTIEALIKLNKKVVIVSPLPEVGYDVPSSSFIVYKRNIDIKKIMPTFDEYKERTKNVYKIFEHLKLNLPVTFVEPYKYLCDEEYCHVIIEGSFIYRDDDHLSTFGSEYITPVFDAVF